MKDFFKDSKFGQRSKQTCNQNGRGKLEFELTPLGSGLPTKIPSRVNLKHDFKIINPEVEMGMQCQGGLEGSQARFGDYFNDTFLKW